MTLPLQICIYPPLYYALFSLSTHHVLCFFLFDGTSVSHFVIRFAISFITCSVVCLIITLCITLLHILLSLSLCVLCSLYQTVFVFSIHCMVCCATLMPFSNSYYAVFSFHCIYCLPFPTPLCVLCYVDALFQLVLCCVSQL